VKERRREGNPRIPRARSLDPWTITCEEEVGGIMKLAEALLAEILEDDQDISTLKDLKVKYE